jgi:hypothetical protein
MRRRELPVEDEKVRARSFKNATDVWICSGTEAFLMMRDRRDNGTPDERGPLEGPKPGTQEHEAFARLVDGEQERRTREDLGERDDSIATGGERRRTTANAQQLPTEPLAEARVLRQSRRSANRARHGGRIRERRSRGLYRSEAALGLIGARAGWIVPEVLKWALVIVVGGVALVALIAMIRGLLWCG